MLRDVLDAIIAFVLGGAFFSLLSVLYAKHPAAFERLASKVAAFLAWVFKRRFRYNEIALEIQSKVNTATEYVDAEVPGILPRKLRVEWVRPGHPEEALKEDGEILLKMHYREGRERNVVMVTLKYLSEELLEKGRRYLDPQLRDSTDLALAKKIFRLSQDEKALACFLNEVLEPQFLDRPSLRDDCALLDRLDFIGFLTRVFLLEMRRVGEQRYPTTASKAILKETRDFAIFLAWFATRKKGEKGEMTFLGATIRVSVVLCIRDETRWRYGIAAHQRRIALETAKGARSIYISAISKENVAIAQAVVKQSQEAGYIEVLQTYTHITSHPDYPATEAICIVCQALPLRGRLAKGEGLLHLALEKAVPEIRDGRIEVMEAAREPGVASKVMVRSLDNRIDDPMLCCRGRRDERSIAIKDELGDEWINIVNYTDDKEELILRAIFTLEADQVSSVFIDRARNTAHVYVTNFQARRKAVGENGVNVRLAERICGMRIQVVVETSPSS